MGKSSSVQSEAENTNLSVISIPAVGLTTKKPGFGGPLVVIVMDVVTGKEFVASEACNVKVRVALGGSVFDNITRFAAVRRSSAVE